jgi:hypothetical protein
VHRHGVGGEQDEVDAETLASLTADNHRRAFTAAMASLIAESSGYLDQDGADPVADLVGHRQHGVWLSRGRADLAHRRAAAGHRPAARQRAGRNARGTC